MKIVYFNPRLEQDYEDVLLSAIRQAIPMIEVVTFTDSNTFLEWLKVPPCFFLVAILNTGNNRSLHRLLTLKRLFLDRKLILVVPNQQEKDTTLVHKFRPHYIHWMQDDYSTLIFVLKKWLMASRELLQQSKNRTPVINGF